MRLMPRRFAVSTTLVLLTTTLLGMREAAPPLSVSNRRKTRRVLRREYWTQGFALCPILHVCIPPPRGAGTAPAVFQAWFWRGVSPEAKLPVEPRCHAGTAQGIGGVDAPQGHPDAPEARPSPAKPGRAAARRAAADAPIYRFALLETYRRFAALPAIRKK
jgi:hypothetical protein